MAVWRRWQLRVRRAFLADLGLAVVAAAGFEIAIVVSTEPGSRPLDPAGYVLAALVPAPVLLHRRWPLSALLGVGGLLLAYYTAGYPGAAPAIVLAAPVLFATRAGYLRWAVAVPVLIIGSGFLFQAVLSDKRSPLTMVAELTPHVALLASAVMLGEVLRGRQALAAETRERLRQAEESREREAARRVAEERLRIARELHDTVAHSMATITVQAGGALHVLDGGGDVRPALAAIRGMSKNTLAEMRSSLSDLREGEPAGPEYGLERLPTLLDAVRAAGLDVELVSGDAVALPPNVDHAAYRIVQEALTNVLRHAGPAATARVRLGYARDALAVEVADDGLGGTGAGGGHGLAGMRERAAAVGGTVTAGPAECGGFVVTARLPTTARKDAMA